MTTKPILDPNSPWDDRVLIVLLWRLHEESKGNTAARIRTAKALDAARPGR